MRTDPKDFPHKLGLRYVQVADVIRQRIVRGQWPEGHRLPSLEELVAEFGVARVTVRQAVTLLANEGLLSAQQGRGTFVTGRPRQDRFISVMATLAELSRVYEDTRPEILTLEEGCHPPPAEGVTGTLAESYTFMRRVHHRDGQPYCVINIFLDERIFRQAPKKFRTQAIIPLLTRMPRVRIAEAHQVMTIGAADTEVARLMRVPVNAPVAEVQRVFRDEKGVVIYMAQVSYRGDAIRLEMDLQP